MVEQNPAGRKRLVFPGFTPQVTEHHWAGRGQAPSKSEALSKERPLPAHPRPIVPSAQVRSDPFPCELDRRIPRTDIVLGSAYVIHARNGGVGIAVKDDGLLGYRL